MAPRRRKYANRKYLDKAEVAALHRAPDELLVKVNAASALIGDPHPITMCNWRREGRGPPYVQHGRNVFYRVGDLRAYNKQNTIHPANNAQSRLHALPDYPADGGE
jgi:hypothetical protein